MTDMTPPFGDSANRRVPTADERENGMPCGPASQALFNGLFWLLEANMKNVGDEAGEVPNADFDNTFLYRSIQALIDAATGGNPAGYVLMTQARARLPIFPEVLNTDGRIVVTTPGAGTVRIPGGVSFLHRGIFSVTTAQTDLATNASKTYHVRWNPTDGFTLKDLASGVYNPSTFSETDTSFDSVYDDMLIARVVTNAGNVATITNLANKDRLFASFVKNTFEQQAVTWAGLPSLSGTINWARTPKQQSVPQMSTEATLSIESIVAVDINAATRYGVGGMVRGYVTSPGYVTPYISGQMTLHVGA